MLMDRRDLLISLSAASLGLARQVQRRAAIMVVASLHKRHASSVHFTYADLYATVARFRPDWVGIEVRQEDLHQSDAYLTENYPKEMVDLRRQYPGQTFGFDWLGDDIASRVLTPEIWAKSPITRLERDMSKARPPYDNSGKRMAARLEALQAQQDDIIGAATPASLADGRYDRITAAYNAAARQLTAGTRFALLTDFYRRRDEVICENIIAAVKARPGAKIAIVSGANHHGAIVTALAAHPEAAVLVPVG